MPAKTIFIVLVAFMVAGCTGNGIDLRAAVGAAAQGTATDAASFLEQGKKEFRAGYFGLAITQFRKALDIDPNSVSAMNGLAACYDMVHRFEVSAQLYRAALVRDPASVATLNNLGYSFYLQRRPELSIIYLREAQRHSASTNLPVRKNVRFVEAALRHLANTAVARKPTLIRNRHPSQLTNRKPKRQSSVRLVRSGPRTYMLHTSWTIGSLRGPGESSIFTPGRVNTPVKLQPEAEVVVANGTGRRRMAARIGRYLKENGYRVTSLVNARTFDKQASQIFYQPGQKQAAQAFAASLLSIPRLVKREKQAVAIHIELGADLLDFDHDLIRTYDKEPDGEGRADL